MAAHDILVMTSELRDQLQAALGSTFQLGQELGGGGMSRVFVAHDAALARAIVVKVLRPDLFGGIAVDRFKREIQLAAQLQHPHIVPILSAGEVDGLPFLTMPFVEGRSLRDQLVGQHGLPLDEAIIVLRDVARALDYAHSRGIIHRDIKPDNVLLSRGAAMVTDFGVAKAVSAAREEASATLTSIGTSIGTPTYMAPEQAAGDPDTDHRADLYAWGVMAYELVAGMPPFTHRAPQRQLAAHMSERPVPVTDHRPQCPPAVAELIMLCLQKEPADRPQSAADLVRALGEPGTPSDGGAQALPTIALASRRTLVRALGLYAASFVLVVALAQAALQLIGLPEWVLPGTMSVMALGLPVVLLTAYVHHGVHTQGTMARLAVRASPHVTWRRTALGGVVAVGSFAALVVGFMVLRALGIGPAASLFARGVMSEQDRILVTDFTVPTGDSTLGPVISEGVRTSLAQSKTITVVAAVRVAAALRRMEQPPTTRLTLPLARQVAEREGIKAVLDGTVTPVRDSYIITLKLYATADSTELASHQELAERATDLIPAIDRATRRLRERIGESFKSVRNAPTLERVTTASLPALRKYTEGWRANTLEGYWPKAIAALEEAVHEDSTFAIAYRQAALVYNNAGIRRGRADTLLRLAFRYRERLPPLERALVEGSYYTYSGAADRRQALVAFERAVAADSTNASALNSLGLVYWDRREPERAIPVFRRMVASNPENMFASENLAGVQVAAGQEAAAQRTVAEAIQRFPGNQYVQSWRRIFWQGDRQRDSARTFCRTLQRSPRLGNRSVATSCLYAISLMEGRIREARGHGARLALLEDSAGRAGADLAAAIDSLEEQLWLLERGPAVARQLDRVLLVHPLGGDPSTLWLYFAAAEVYAVAGQPTRAREMIARYDAQVPDTLQRRRLHTEREIALGEIAIAEGSYGAAIRAFERADTLYDGHPQECDVCVLPRLARAYDLADQRDQAIAAFEQYLASRYVWRRTSTDHLFYAGTLKRLGELYDAKGDRAKAATYLARFAELWADADPELQPKVAEARRRLARLESGTR